MKAELENANWIVAGIRESLEKIKEARQEEISEWDSMAEEDEVWE